MRKEGKTMYLKLKETTIYYEIYGEGVPILMLHGFPLDHNVMKASMEPIFLKRKGYKRIYFDLPHMGKSSSDSSIRSSDDILNVVSEFIDNIILPDSFLIVSESYGAYLARGAISKYNKRVKACLFICPVIIPEPFKRKLPKLKVFEGDKDFIATLKKREVQEFRLCVFQNENVWNRFKSEILLPIQVSNKPILDQIYSHGYKLSFDVDKKIKSFNGPVLFLMGRQDVSTGYRDAWNLLESYPRASFVVLDMAGHNLQIEQPKVFNCLVSNWLDRIEFEKK
jgi:pimeloyl-ACP methyl ester carboxylesterase